MLPLPSFIIPFCLSLIFLLPQNLLAADAGKSSSSPAAGGGLLIWPVCYVRRKNPIGGWLLYYFIGLYVGLFISIALTVPSSSNYNPLEWDDKFHYFLFIITTIPGEIFLLAQVFLSFFLLSKKRRDWKYIEILKKVLLADVVFSAVSIPIEVSLWPVSIFFSVYSAILSLIWFFYFRNSARVQYVFKDKLWNPEILYPSVKVKKI
jgi:hypothetical protein